MRPDKQAKRMPQAVRDAVAERSGGTCESCGEAPAHDIHHRKYLSRGGTHDVSNLLHLCGLGNTSGCHGKAHNGGEETGLSVPSWARHETWPVMRRGEWVLLFDAPDDEQRWWREITETTADLLRGGSR
jgi:hypothetical protein